jgi:TonB family protein
MSHLRLLLISLLLTTMFACLIARGAVAEAQAQVSSAATADESQRGVKLLEQGDLDGAIKALRAAVKQNKKDATAWRYLGLALTRKNDLKGAGNALETAIKLNPFDAASHAGLAYILLMTEKTGEAALEASQALVLDGFNADAHYVMGVVYARRNNPTAALGQANLVLQLCPNFALAWLLKSQAILGLCGKEISANISSAPTAPPLSPEERKKNRLASASFYREAADSLEQYLLLAPGVDDAALWREELESLRVYAAYAGEGKSETLFPDEVQTKPRILSKPSPTYTESARRTQLGGTVILLLTCAADGTIKYIVPLQSLGRGLTEKAVDAAREIKFVPATKNGQPVSQQIIIEYNFNVF